MQRSLRCLLATISMLLLFSTSCASGYAVNTVPITPTLVTSKATAQPAVATPTSPPSVATPFATVSTIPAVTPSLGGPLATPTPTGIWIEVISTSPEHAIITPGNTAVVPFSNEVAVLMHYPYPLGSPQTGSFQPYNIQITVEPSTRTIEKGNWPRADVLSFRLAGEATGSFMVTVRVPEKNESTTFTVRILEPTPKTVSTPQGARTVTLDDNGRSIDLKTGESFLLALGTGYDWTITIADPTVISRVPNVAVVQGAQGIYEAKKPGRTTLSATGDPECRKAKPPCGVPSRAFQIEVVVH